MGNVIEIDSWLLNRRWNYTSPAEWTEIREEICGENFVDDTRTACRVLIFAAPTVGGNRPPLQQL
jgi:hypothetical protein